MKAAGLAMMSGGIALLGCAPVTPTPSPYAVINGDPSRALTIPEIGQDEWTLSRERLARMRSQLPRRPYAQRVQLGMIEPTSGKLYQARGAVAISPDNAARLILLGPGGTTAIDLWVTRDRFRLVVPSIKLEKRGGSDPSEARGLPVGLLRWWFLQPLQGSLKLARSSRSEVAFLMRDGPATVTIRTNGERFIAVRREGARMEGLEWLGHGLTPHAGSRGKYIDGEWGMRVHVLVEEVLPDEPAPEAFSDPDLQGVAL